MRNFSQGTTEPSDHPHVKTCMALFVALCLVGVLSINGERVSCGQVRQDNGNIVLNCGNVAHPADLWFRNLYVVDPMLKRAGGPLPVHGYIVYQPIPIHVLNYRIEDVIQAAAKGSQSQAHNNVNVNLRPPELPYLAQKEERIVHTTQSLDVNLQYLPVPGKSAHYADDGAGSQGDSPLRKTTPGQDRTVAFSDSGQPEEDLDLEGKNALEAEEEILPGDTDASIDGSIDYKNASTDIEQ